MYTSNYNPDLHQGTQPVRVLEENLRVAFHTIHPQFVQQIENEVEAGRLRRTIRYRIGDEPIDFSMPCLNGDGEIMLQESFLSYLWCISYALLTVNFFGMEKPLLAGKPIGSLDVTGDDCTEAFCVLEYGLLLKSLFKPWPIDLTNPQFYPGPIGGLMTDADDLIPKANDVFLKAMEFIFCHEFAHAQLNHIGEIKDMTQEEILQSSKQREYAADARAMELVFDSKDGRGDLVRSSAGVIAALAAILLFSSRISSTTHPDQDDRMKTLLYMRNLDNNDQLWAFAVLAFWLFARKYQLPINWETRVTSLRECFDVLMLQFKNLKMQETATISIKTA